MLVISMPGGSEIILILVIVFVYFGGLVHVIRRRDMERETKLLWLLLVIFAPVMGTIIYYLWGRDIKPVKS